MSEDFKWNDELVKEFVRIRIRDENPNIKNPFSDYVTEGRIEEFKQLKQNSNKDWDVVRLKQRDGKVIEGITIAYNDKYLNERIKTWNELGIEIHSVRRISDNEVFSVGDGCSGFGYEEISHFTIAGKEMIASFKSGIFSNIDFLFKKAKQKLFTTEDGKDIYEGDEYWILFIESGSSWIPSKTKASEHTIADVTKSYMKRFSTEELAKEYAIMHKPCLSLDDLLSAWGGGDGKSKEYYANAPLFLNFKKLVEEKINNGER